MISNNADIIEEMRKNARLVLITPKGSFPYYKNFGSQINYAQNEALILAEARAALSGLDGVYVKSVEKINAAAIFHISVNDEQRQVEVKYGN